jgi:hypothetical protein
MGGKMDYKYNIGDLIYTNIGELKIVDKTVIEYKNNAIVKGYSYECLVCGNKDKISEYTLNLKRGCNVCGNSRKILIGYNDMWTTAPEMANFLSDFKEGFIYTSNTKKKALFKCPDCGYEEKKSICNVKRDIKNKQKPTCSKCSDGLSYGEKFMIALFVQTPYIYRTQISFAWSKNVKSLNEKLCGRKVYDGYLPELNRVIEIHGRQHYVKGFSQNRTLEEEQLNDKLKEKIAKENGTPMIIIDASESNPEYIKNSILSSELNLLCNLGNIDWIKCQEFACSSFVKIASDLWNEGMKNTRDIMGKMNLSRSTVVRYLNQGADCVHMIQKK